VSATDRLQSRARVLAFLLCAVAAAPRIAAAQPAPPSVTDADIARAAKNRPVISDQDIEKAAKKHRMPSDAELAGVPVPSTPRVDALPQPLTQRRVDLGAVARGYEAMGQASAGASAFGSGPSLLVFVSFSMPEPTLGRLVDQAARAGATLVLRGLVDNSLQKTVGRVQRLIGERRVGFQIDPQAFDRFSVSATPTFVLIKDGAVPAPCAAGTCFPANTFVSTAGDVSLDYALEFFDRAAPSFGPAAQSFLTKMKGR
jgi:conjugal transfer pilus assembly protein TrbC